MRNVFKMFYLSNLLVKCRVRGSSLISCYKHYMALSRFCHELKIVIVFVIHIRIRNNMNKYMYEYNVLSSKCYIKYTSTLYGLTSYHKNVHDY